MGDAEKIWQAGSSVAQVHGGAVIPPASRAAVTALPQDRPVSPALPDPAVFSASLAGQVSALAAIQNASDLDQIVDRIHEFSSAHSSDNDAVVSGISTAFAKMHDTKLLALCRQWEEKYPGDRGVITASLNGVWRYGAPEGFGPVRGLARAYEIISGSMRSATVLAQANPNGVRPDIVGLYNASSLRDVLNVYFDQAGKTINGYHGNSEGLATQFLISNPPLPDRSADNEQNPNQVMVGQEEYYGKSENFSSEEGHYEDKEAIMSKLESAGIPRQVIYSNPGMKTGADVAENAEPNLQEKAIPPSTPEDMIRQVLGSLAGQGPISGSVEDLVGDILDRTVDPWAEPNVIGDVMSGGDDMPFDEIRSQN